MSEPTVGVIRQARTMLFLLMTCVLLSRGGARAFGMIPPFCDETCGGTVDCNTECYVDQFHFDQDQPTSCYVYGDYAMPCCGDGLCDATSEVGTCNQDCGTPGSGCGECVPGYPNACGSGSVCDSGGCCVTIPNCPGSSNDSCGNDPPKPSPPCFDSYCYQQSDCCSGDYCLMNFPVEDWLHGVDFGVCVPNVDHRPAPVPKAK
jgi:hypothetical protein